MTNQRMLPASSIASVELYPVLQGFYRSTSGVVVSLGVRELNSRARGVVDGIALCGEIVYCDSDDACLATIHGATYEHVVQPDYSDLLRTIKNHVQYARVKEHPICDQLRWLVNRTVTTPKAYIELTDGHRVVPLSREAMAWMLNVSRESVSRQVNALIASGELRKYGYKLMVHKDTIQWP